VKFISSGFINPYPQRRPTHLYEATGNKSEEHHSPAHIHCTPPFDLPNHNAETGARRRENPGKALVSPFMPQLNIRPGSVCSKFVKKKKMHTGAVSIHEKQTKDQSSLQLVSLKMGDLNPISIAGSEGT